MRFDRILPLLLALSLVAVGSPIGAQPGGLAARAGEVGLGLVLRELGNVGIFMQTTGHPDDENSALLAMLNRGQGIRTTLLTATRGTGGQNEIGPELFEALSVLRTEELASVHRFDGTEQYFARAIDFGYSFSVDETYRKWGRQEILSDYVRMIRTIRPDVMVTMRPEGEMGGAHHQAQARITGEAFRLAADPKAFPEQLAEGLRPWQPRKLYYQESFIVAPDAAVPAGQLLVKTDIYDPLLGQTYAEIGLEARSNHKCQGMAQLLFLPGSPSASTWRLGDTALPGGTSRPDTSLFDGIDTSINGLAHFAKQPAPEALVSGLASISRQVEKARQAFDTQGPAAAREPILAGLAAVRKLRADLKAIDVDDSARFEIDYRLAGKEDQFQRAAVLAQGIRIDVLSDDGVVIGGQPVHVQAVVANRGTETVSVKAIALAGFDGNASCPAVEVKGGSVMPRCTATVSIPAAARLTTPYWRPLPDAARYEFDKDVPFGVPFRPTPFRARIVLGIGSADVVVDQPVEYRYEGNIFSGEKRMELLVVPRFSVTTTPEIAIVPTTAGAAASGAMPGTKPAAVPVADREIRVTVTNGNKGPAKGEARLDVPAGWKVVPTSAPVEFSREDGAETVRFRVTPPVGAKPGQFTITAKVSAGTETFDQGYQVIEYPHIHRRHRIVPASTSVKLVNVKVAPRLKVGYVMGVGDQVPPAIEQLGAQVELLDADDLSWGNLSQYDAIVTGVRAYDRRADLKANNRRLIDYVEKGGTLVVQYNRTAFNEAQYGPYPAKVTSNRVTDETAPVEVLAPANSIFNFPNKIGDDAWKGWVQERGLSFLGDEDPRYVDLVQLQDPFPANSGMKRGALVEANVGKGHWIYVGLGLWRQLPAGTDGAYQLFANLISLGKAPAASAPRQK
jgi:LmbE family N-acetylglucosaminyl deacetylase